MLVAALTFAQLPVTPKTWYGPVTATFRVQFSGNPYDPDSNDVRVRFTGPKGDPIERIAYYDEEAASWKATLVTELPGNYVAALYRNGERKSEPSTEGTLDASKPLKFGFIRRDPILTNRFRRDDGSVYYPFGYNLGWQDPALPKLPEQIGLMAKAGVNWTRIWACAWDGKNPWWPDKEAKADASQLWDPALQKWQAIVDSADRNGVPFQMVMFHHGAFSSTVNPNWPDHPWNAKNGGFLKSAADFFTDPEAKRRAKMWLRYAVARFAHSPNVLAWELFNEVEWVDARYANRWPDIETWHAEMADYIRSIDPYHHLITTSSATDRPDLWRAMDYVQPHTYPSNLSAAILGAERIAGKPTFFGEFGPGGGNASNRHVLREGALAGVFANDGGAGQYWYWDVVHKENLYDEVAKLRKAIDLSGIANHATARRIPLRIDSDVRADAVLSPGLGWAATKSTTFTLPDDLSPEKIGELSGYLQGSAGEHRDMFPAPLTVRFRATSAGQVALRLEQAAKNGASVTVALDGKTIFSADYPAGTAETRIGKTVEATFEPGEHVLTVTNAGKDWVQFSSVRVTGLAPAASVIAIADTSRILARVTAAEGTTAKTVTLVGLPVRDGTLSGTAFDLDTGETKPISLKVTNGRAPLDLTRDTLLILTP